MDGRAGATGVPMDGRAGAAAAGAALGRRGAMMFCPPRAVRQRKKWKKWMTSSKLWEQLHNLLNG
jgi:hypothetical protein